VLLTRATSTPVRRGDLDRVCRRRDSHDGDTKAKDESANNELRNDLGRRSDDHTEDDGPSANEHALSATVSVGQNSGERGTDHGPAEDSSARTWILRYDERDESRLHRVEREDDRDVDTGGARVEGVLEVRHGQDGGHERAVVAVCTGTAEGNEDGDWRIGVSERVSVHEVWSLVMGKPHSQYR
jgi:hypothetical protein